MRSQIIQSSGDNVYRHLAVEEYLLNSLEPDTRILYLWQSRSAVVIGKNQNPWLECDLDAMAARKIAMARRLSGGGAVFHDHGNLNFSFILWQEHYEKQVLSQMIVDAVRALGIEATIGDRHVLLADGRKFSGNAFAIRRKKVLHHGTLLIDSDLALLQEVLAPTCAGIETKGIRSVSAPVVNLAELKPELTVEDVIGAIAAAYNGDSGTAAFEGNVVRELQQVYESDEWLYQRTPRFSVQADIEHDGRRLSLEATVVKAVVTSATTWPDDPGIGDDCVGMPFHELLKQYPALQVKDVD